MYPYQADEVVELKKPHPCGSKLWQVLRVGAEIKLQCKGCGQVLSLQRNRLEKMTRKISAPPAGTGTPTEAKD